MTDQIKITGTMIPVLMLGSHYGRTPADLWDEALGLVERPRIDNGHVRRGLTLEETVIREWLARNGDPDYELQAEPVVERDGAWFTGHVDCLVLGSPRIVLEVKCPTSRRVWDIRDDGCPREYVLQAAWYAMVTQSDHAEVLVWSCDDWDYLSYTVPRSDKLESLMVRKALEFADHVLRGERPSNWSDESSQVPVIGQRTVEAPEGMVELLRDLDQAETVKKGAEKRSSEIKSQLLSMWPEDAKGIRSAIGTLSLQTGRISTTTDTKSLATDYPEINWAAYQRVVEGQPFLVWRSKKTKE